MKGFVKLGKHREVEHSNTFYSFINSFISLSIFIIVFFQDPVQTSVKRKRRILSDYNGKEKKSG